MKRFRARIPMVGLVGAAILGCAPSAGAVAQQDDWCDADDRDSRRTCEVREFEVSTSGHLRVDATPNGGVSVYAWDRNEVRILAKVVVRGEDGARAAEIADDISISTRGTIEADGPRTGRGESWSVSFRIWVPSSYDLDLESRNGGLGVEGVEGTLDLLTTNGGIHLEDVAGDVSARTTNGGLSVVLSGSAWDGAGLDAQTTNGGVTLVVPDGYSAHLEAGTRNGGLTIDVPITVSGRFGRRIAADLGAGGAPIRVTTVNGSIRITPR